MAPRKKAAKPEAAAASVSAKNLAEFIGVEGDGEQLAKAVDLAIAAAEAYIGAPLPDELPHGIAQGVKLLATKLLIGGELEGPVEADTIPLVVRYYWRAARAAN